MKRVGLIILAAVTATATLSYFYFRTHLLNAQAKAQELQSVVEKVQDELSGHTKYTAFITVGKQSLASQTKLLTATVKREEGVTQQIERVVLPGVSSSGTVALWYVAEYSFGFDLKPNQYDIRAVPSGIEVRIKKPSLVATPAVTNIRYKILSGGILTDEKEALLRLTKDASKRAATQGKLVASEPATVALCEKNLIEFLHNVLAKQPGVKVVPHIRISYV